MAYCQQWLSSVVRAGCALDAAPGCQQAWEASRRGGLRPARRDALQRSLTLGTATLAGRAIATWRNHHSPGCPASAEPLNTIGSRATGPTAGRTAVVRPNRPRGGFRRIANIPHCEIARCPDVLEMESGKVRELVTKQSLINAARWLHTRLPFLSASIDVPRRHDAEDWRRQRVFGEFGENSRMCFWRQQKHVHTPLRDAPRHFRAATLETPSALRAHVHVDRAVHHG